MKYITFHKAKVCCLRMIEKGQWNIIPIALHLSVVLCPKIKAKSLGVGVWEPVYYLYTVYHNWEIKDPTVE